MTQSVNRETWLNQATEILAEGMFKPHGWTLPAMKVSVGLPHGRDQRTVLIQYFAADRSADKIMQVFLNPKVGESYQALCLLYGVCRRQLPPQCPRGHEPQGQDLNDQLRAIADALGPYPQATLTLPERAKQLTRMIKAHCPACGFVCRATWRHFQRGMPICGACYTRSAKDAPEGTPEHPVITLVIDQKDLPDWARQAKSA